MSKKGLENGSYMLQVLQVSVVVQVTITTHWLL